MKLSKNKFELLLAEKELTLTKLAALSGISRQNISTIKQRGTCSPCTAAKLAKGFGVSVAEILDMEVTA